MTTTQDLAERIADCDQMPYGRERTLLAERLVAEADAAGDVALGVAARHVLIPSYHYGPAAEPQKVFAAFTWNLARWDATPEEFDATARHKLLWYFKWVTGNATMYPQVSWAQLEQMLADMKDRYERAGEELAPYEKQRYLQAAHRYGEADPRAVEAYEAWNALPRTRRSDCQACEPTDRAERLSRLGRHEEAVAVALPVLAESGCAEQPQQMIDASLLSLLHAGHAAQAAYEHNRGVRLRRRDGDHARLDAHVLACAVVGRYGRGLDLLEEALHQVDGSPVPWNRLRLAAAGVRLLSGLVAAGHGDEPVSAIRPDTRWSEPRAASQLLDELRAEALDLAAQFDARNGTTVVGDRTRAWFDAPDLPDVESWPRTRRPRLDRTPAGVVPAPEPPASLPDRLDALALLQAEVGTTGEAAAWDRLVAEWAALRPRLEAEAPDLLTARAADVARLDLSAARHALDAAPEPDDALRDGLAAAGEALLAAGDEPEGRLVALQVHAVDAVRRAQAGPESLQADFSAAVDLADLVTAACEAAGASEPTAPGRAPAAQAKAEVALLGVRLAQTLRDEDAARDAHGAAMRAAQAAAAAYEALDPALLSGRQLGRLAFVLLIGTDGLDHEDALTLLDRGLALLPPGVRAHERALLLDAKAYRLAALERREEAAEALDEAAVAATVAGETAMATSCTARAGGIHLDLDHPDEAAARLERAVAGLGVEDPATGARRVPYGMYADLILCLARTGRALDAAEVAEGVARLLHEHPPTGDDPRHAFEAGRAAYLGARALRALDENDAASRLAATSADMHAMHDTVLARVEAIDLAAACASTPTERAALLARAVELAAGEGDVWFTADLRRRYADAVDDADGPDAALALLDALDADLRGLDVEGDDAQQRGWHLAASGHLRAAVLFNAGRAEEAVVAVEPVAQSFGDVGDHDAAIRAVCLHVEALYRAGRLDAAAALGRGVADQALALGRAEHARAVGGTLARVLDDAGEPDAAEEVWERYGGSRDEE